MIPIYLEPGATRIALIGDGACILRRLRWLQEAGAEPDVWSAAPIDELVEAAGEFLTRRLPARAELACYHVIWIADLAREAAEELANTARRVRVLVNVEDVVDLCAFHTPAVVRRGKLTLAAGTGGASPAVAKAAREHLAGAFPESWSDAVEDIAKARAALRREGATAETLSKDARQRLSARGLTTHTLA
jgi:precorrin-2 dehydrogenase / sirohydrochlorin ferrochelatase